MECSKGLFGESWGIWDRLSGIVADFDEDTLVAATGDGDPSDVLAGQGDGMNAIVAGDGDLIDLVTVGVEGGDDERSGCI